MRVARYLTFRGSERQEVGATGDQTCRIGDSRWNKTTQHVCLLRQHQHHTDKQPTTRTVMWSRKGAETLSEVEQAFNRTLRFFGPMSDVKVTGQVMASSAKAAPTSRLTRPVPQHRLTTGVFTSTL